MGGKTWSREEEEVYWLQLIPHSPKRLGEDIEKNEEQTWAWVAKKMTEIMGDKARRKYTALGVFEHYFQNTYLGRFSPNGGKLPWKYYKHEQEMKKQKAVGQESSEDESADAQSQASADTEPEVPAAGKPATGKPAPGNADVPIEIDSDNCQYPDFRSHFRAPLQPERFAVPSAPPSSPSLGPGPFPPSPCYVDPFLANHVRAHNTEAEEGGPFMSQSVGPWGNVAAHRAYRYHL